MKKFEISNLTCKINNKSIIKNFTLKTNNKDVIAIVGPNGAGKSSLLKAIMGHFSIKKIGKITFNNKNITNLDTNAIANLGFFYCMQNPTELNGVKNLDLLKLLSSNTSNNDFSSTYKFIKQGIDDLHLPNEILTRDVNVNFSGGQKKKNEILQSMLFKPSVLLIDEIDSGLDVDAMKIIAKYINQQRHNSIILVVSHHLEFLKFIKPTKIVVLINGTKIKEGNLDIIKLIETKGFEPFIDKNELNNDEFSKTDPFVCSTQI